MKISKHSVVALDYILTDNQGEILDQSAAGQFVYLHGADNIIPGLENALAGKQAGDRLKVVVEPAQGYGEHNASLTQAVPIDMFESPDDVMVGQKFHAESGEGHQIVVTVTAVENGTVTIDGNHPLAGKQLNFDVTVVEVRDATEEEIEHGHVHMPGQHHH